MKHVIITLCTLVFLPASVWSGPLWDKTKEVTSGTLEMVGETATSVSEAVSGEKEPVSKTRLKVDAMAEQALARLIKTYPAVENQLKKAIGHAIFDSRRMSLLLATGYGQGVAVNSKTNHRTYMKMATGGVNLGYGAQFYQLIFIFNSSDSLNNFIHSGWDVNADADAVAGNDAESLGMRLADGTLVYKLNEKGLMLSATITGTKFWQWNELNAL